MIYRKSNARVLKNSCDGTLWTATYKNGKIILNIFDFTWVRFAIVCKMSSRTWPIKCQINLTYHVFVFLLPHTLNQLFTFVAMSFLYLCVFCCSFFIFVFIYICFSWSTCNQELPIHKKKLIKSVLEIIKSHSLPKGHKMWILSKWAQIFLDMFIALLGMRSIVS